MQASSAIPVSCAPPVTDLLFTNWSTARFAMVGHDPLPLMLWKMASSSALIAAGTSVKRAGLTMLA